MTDRNIDLKLFIAIWNRQQGFATPALHLRMAKWLEANWRAGNTRLLLMAFRASGKSTLVGLFCAWLFYQKPELRILVLAADHNLAARLVRNVKRVIERHPLTQHLRPHYPDQWGADRFTLRRGLELRDPSMLAKGVQANLTGARADVVICDDVEVPNTCDTTEKRADLRTRLSELSYILVPGGTQLYVGTPHSYYTIYADRPRREIGEEQPFLKGFRRLKLPVIDRGGTSLWPERYGDEDIAAMRRRTGENKFASQMLLEPVNIAEGRLDPDQLRVYAQGLHYHEARGQICLSLGATRLTAASAWWDPSFGAQGGDDSVLAVVFSDMEGNYYLHQLRYLTTSAEIDVDEATQQCRQVALALRNVYAPAVALEINGLGRFLPGILRQEIARAGAPCAVREVTSRRPKATRIVEAFDAVMAAGALYVHEAVCDTPFMQEMREWRPEAASARDDGLDAVAGALNQAPVRLKTPPGTGERQHWQGAQPGEATSGDFDV